MNPIYNKGKFQSLDYGYFDDDIVSGVNEYEIGVVDTSRLLRDQATVVISNRPGESPFAGNYLLLVEKGDASS